MKISLSDKIKALESRIKSNKEELLIEDDFKMARELRNRILSDKKKLEGLRR